MENSLRFTFLRKFRGLLAGDMLNIGRDPILLFASIAPVILTVVLRFLVPFISGLLMKYLGFDLSPHYPLVMSFFILLPAMLFGTVIGFTIVDERDENVLIYYAVTPLSGGGYLLYRLLLPMVLGFLSAYLIAGFTGLISCNFLMLTPVALLASLEAPLFVLFLGSFAANKVEALTISKGSGLLDMAPVAGYLLPAPWHFLAGIFPPYWVAKAFIAGYAGDYSAYRLYLAGGLIVHLIFLAFMLGHFNRRIS